MCESRKFVRGSPTLTTFSFKWIRGEDHNITRWRADDGPALNAGLVFSGDKTIIAKKPYMFVIFRGGGGGGGEGVRPPAPLWIRRT